MKKIKIIIIQFFVLITFLSNAQSHEDCWNYPITESTDWRESNSSNDWDWTQEQFEIFIIGNSGPTYVYSPFWDNAGIANKNKNLLPFQQYPDAIDKDFHPEDGWELVIKDFGTAQDPVDYTYFVLYNRYTGLLRSFMLLPNQISDMSFANVKVEFTNSRLSALFQHLDPIGKEVKLFNTSLFANYKSDYSYTTNYWISHEFLTAYDPCTCFDYEPYNYNNNELYITLSYVKQQDNTITAKITGTVLLNEDVVVGGSVKQSDPGVSSFGLDNTLKAISTGQKTYKEWSAFEKYLDKTNLNIHNNILNKEKLWAEIEKSKKTYPELYDKMLEQMFRSTTNTPVTKANFLSGAVDLNPEYSAPNLGFFEKDLVKGVASFIPYAGAALAIYNLYAQGGKSKTSLSTVKKGPTMFDVNLKLDGTMILNSTLNSQTFYLPGFNLRPNNNYETTYKNILGVFNILELPDFEYYEILPVVTNLTKDEFGNIPLYHSGNQCKLDHSEFNDEDGAGNITFRQYRPKSSLKYVVNPASNLEVISVEATIVLGYEASDKLFLRKVSDFNLQTTKAIPFYPYITKVGDNGELFDRAHRIERFLNPLPLGGRIENKNLGSHTYATIINNDIEGGVLNDSLVNPLPVNKTRIESIEENTNLIFDHISYGFTWNSPGEIKFRTQFLPVTCFDKLNFTILGTNNLPKAYVKVLVILKHKTDPDIEPVSLVFSYDLLDKLQTATMAPEKGSYSSEVIAGLFSRTTEGPWKCGASYQFKAVQLSDYTFSTKPLKMINTPLSSLWFSERVKTYNGESNLTIIGDLEIPENSIIPANSLIKAGGEITIGQNVTIGPGTEIYSAISIEAVNNNVFFPNVKLAIEPFNSMILDCDNYDYSLNHLGDDEIINFCKSASYRELALNSQPDIDTSELNKYHKKTFDFNLYPNPTSRIVNVELPEMAEGGVYDITVMDIRGQVMSEMRILPSETVGSVYEMKVSHLTAGIYFVRLVIDGEAKVKRLVIL